MMTKLEREFVKVLKEYLERGEEPSARTVYIELIDRGISTANEQSIRHYGPGARYTNRRKVAIEEWYDYLMRES